MRGKVLTCKQPQQPDCPPGVSFPRVPEPSAAAAGGWRRRGARAQASVRRSVSAGTARRQQHAVTPGTSTSDPVRQHTFTGTLEPINRVIIAFVARLLNDNTSPRIFINHMSVS